MSFCEFCGEKLMDETDYCSKCTQVKSERKMSADKLYYIIMLILNFIMPFAVPYPVCLKFIEMIEKGLGNGLISDRLAICLRQGIALFDSFHLEEQNLYIVAYLACFVLSGIILAIPVIFRKINFHFSFCIPSAVTVFLSLLLNIAFFALIMLKSLTGVDFNVFNVLIIAVIGYFTIKLHLCFIALMIVNWLNLKDSHTSEFSVGSER